MHQATPSSFDPRTRHVLGDILADAARMTAEQLAGIIRDARWHGTGAVDDTAVGNYLAGHLLLAGVAPAITVHLYGARAIVEDTRTRHVLATGRLAGGIAELADLLAAGVDEFADLHTFQPDPWGEADFAEAFATGPLLDSEPATA